MPLLQKITLEKKSVSSTKSFYWDISTQESELTDGINFPRHLPFFERWDMNFLWVHKSQRREQRDLTTRCDVREGQPHSLICLQIQSSLGGPLPSPPIPSPPPTEPNNLNVGLHAHVIINELCPLSRPYPFHPQQIKTKSNLPGYPWQHAASQMFLRFSNPKKDSKSFKHCYELLIQGYQRLIYSWCWSSYLKT